MVSIAERITGISESEVLGIDFGNKCEPEDFSYITYSLDMKANSGHVREESSEYLKSLGLN